ncbi:DUF4132 domain-containing protein [Myxococcota bacterium]|nr:DUF4132 domain-containing protein [Myxococcota bacterium]MBU1380364.1 DUF4132 domain-containing protein [Myxococcota bacterium]MBU1498299.1 DUF4132 domain-containing protein [Myxococcota bacterium]
MKQTAGNTVNWVSTDTGYSLAIENGKIICANAKGAQLKSIPKQVRDSEDYEKMKNLQDFLELHKLDCMSSVTKWMLGTVPLSLKVISGVFPDPYWREILTNALIFRTKNGEINASDGGFLRGWDDKKGLGFVDMDGESVWMKDGNIVIPHPVLIPDIDEWRALGAEMEFTQAFDQLFREIHVKAPEVKPDDDSLETWSGGEFNTLMQVMSLCSQKGYRVKAGHAVCSIIENGRNVEARFYIGDDSPDYYTSTGDLSWNDETGETLKFADVGPVAWSEGVLMAATIYSRRNVDEGGEDE